MDFIHKVLLQLIRTQHIKDVMWIRRSIHQRLAGPNPVTFVDVDMLALGNKVFLHIAHLIVDENFALAFHETAVGDFSVDLGDDRLFFRLPRLEKLHHARKTSRDVLGLGRFARNLCQDITGIYHGPFLDKNMGSNRQ